MRLSGLHHPGQRREGDLEAGVRALEDERGIDLILDVYCKATADIR